MGRNTSGWGDIWVGVRNNSPAQKEDGSWSMSQRLQGFPKDAGSPEQASQGLSDGELSPEPRLKQRVTEKGTAPSTAAPRSSSSVAAASRLGVGGCT